MSFSRSDTPALYCQESTPCSCQLLSPKEGLAAKLESSHCRHLLNRLSQSSFADGFILELILEITKLGFILGSRSLHLGLLKSTICRGMCVYVHVCLCVRAFVCEGGEGQGDRERKRGKPIRLLSSSDCDLFQNIFNGLLILCQNYSGTLNQKNLQKNSHAGLLYSAFLLLVTF